MAEIAKPDRLGALKVIALCAGAGGLASWAVSAGFGEVAVFSKAFAERGIGGALIETAVNIPFNIIYGAPSIIPGALLGGSVGGVVVNLKINPAKTLAALGVLSGLGVYSKGWNGFRNGVSDFLQGAYRWMNDTWQGPASHYKYNKGTKSGWRSKATPDSLDGKAIKNEGSQTIVRGENSAAKTCEAYIQQATARRSEELAQAQTVFHAPTTPMPVPQKPHLAGGSTIFLPFAAAVVADKVAGKFFGRKK